MSFETIQDFIAMGGHGPYVWSAWSIAAVVLAWNVIAPMRLRRRVVAEQRALYLREAMHRETAQPPLQQEGGAS